MQYYSILAGAHLCAKLPAAGASPSPSPSVSSSSSSAMLSRSSLLNQLDAEDPVAQALNKMIEPDDKVCVVRVWWEGHVLSSIKVLYNG